MKLYIRRGIEENGDILYNFDGKYVRAGYEQNGDILYNINGKYIRAGYYEYGDIVYNIDGKYIRRGYYEYGDIVYNIDGKYIRRGYYQYGNIVFNINEDTGGCFVTTACIRAKGLPDDCHELAVLRQFRDEWITRQPEGNHEIQEYYDVAPCIVERIEKSTDAQKVFEKLYFELIIPCVNLIEEDKCFDAYLLYKETMFELKKMYCR